MIWCINDDACNVPIQIVWLDVQVVRSADIVVAAVGRAEMVKGDWIKEGAVVIDVGINSVDDASKKAG
jgi:5,10-methylene-tetrahydrofolate dehydrogenase/methenyl tetrahydrofolate cyclohydrolase